MMNLQSIVDRLSFEGISYGIPVARDRVLVIANEQRVDVLPDEVTPAHLDELVQAVKLIK